MSEKHLPDVWKKVAIADVAKVVTGKTPSTAKQEYYKGTIPFVAPGDLGEVKYVQNAEKTLTLEGGKYSPTIPADSTLFTCIGTIGKIGIASKELRTNQQINSAIPEHIDAEYLYYALAHLSKRIKKLASVQVMPIINKTEFENQIIFIPERRELQKLISAQLTQLDKIIALRKQRVEKLKHIKQAYLFVLLDV